MYGLGFRVWDLGYHFLGLGCVFILAAVPSHGQFERAIRDV